MMMNWILIMTVEELILKLQKIKNKKNQIKMDTPSSGFLLYRVIRDIQITETSSSNFVIIDWKRE